MMIKDEVIEGYEACGTCGYDHGLEQEHAQRWHAEDTINQARRYLGANPRMWDSARVAHDDAVDLFARHDYVYAARRAIRSMEYSLGVFSPIVQRVKAELGW